MKGNADAFKPLTGLPISTYFSAFKIQWLLNNVEEIKAADEKGDVFFGTINTWVLYNLTGGKEFKTEPSNACRTFLMNLKKIDYEEELLKKFGIKRESLPKICPSFSEFGTVEDFEGLKQLKVVSILGDQQASALGQGLTKPGKLKNTYGTGSFLLCNTGSKMHTEAEGLLGTVLAQLKNGEVLYALEGAIECGGNTINWMRDSLELFTGFGEMENQISKLESSEGIFFLPCFSGIYSPFWDVNAPSMVVGMTNRTTKSHLVRACMEGIAYRTRDCTEVLKKFIELKEIYVDGGLTKNAFFLKFQKEVLGIDLSKGIFLSFSKE